MQNLISSSVKASDMVLQKNTQYRFRRTILGNLFFVILGEISDISV